MESKNPHPLESITKQSGLSMLEAMIPFVEYPWKLPLALFIKFQEIKLILHAFQSLEHLSKIGLHKEASTPLDLICSLTGMNPQMANMLLTFSDLGKDSLFSGASADFSNIPFDIETLKSFLRETGTNSPITKEPSTPPKSDLSGDLFDQKLQSILAEYDLAEASALTEQTESF